MIYYTYCMLIDKIIYLTVQGFLFGYGPCLATCAPVLLPYVGTKKTWKEGFFAALSFSLGRLAVYVVLGGLFGYFGAFIMKYYYSTGMFHYLKAVLSLILIVIGITVVLGKNFNVKFCGAGEGNMAVLGMLVGISPCAPLIGILLEIALLSDNFFAGFAYSFFFGIGTVLSPMLLIAAVIPMIGGRFNQKVFRIFTYLCGSMMVLAGMYILLK
jgi:sulfite exporter TauE/SafE